MTETTFETVDLGGTQPPGICYECAQHGLVHVTSGVAFVRCRHSEMSGYRDTSGQWKMMHGLSSDQFKRAVMHGVFLGEQLHVDRQTPDLVEQ